MCIYFWDLKASAFGFAALHQVVCIKFVLTKEVILSAIVITLELVSLWADRCVRKRQLTISS